MTHRQCRVTGARLAQWYQAGHRTRKSACRLHTQVDEDRGDGPAAHFQTAHSKLTVDVAVDRVMDIDVLLWFAEWDTLQSALPTMLLSDV